jgi:hypothetical protein
VSKLAAIDAATSEIAKQVAGYLQTLEDSGALIYETGKLT